MLIDLNVEWLPWQAEINEDPTRFKLIHKGRRLGFTRYLAQFVVTRMLDGTYERVMWGDTVNGNIDKYIERYFKPLLKQLPDSIWSWGKQAKMLTINGATCDFRSADNPENWEGLGYSLICLNEAGIILKNSYLYDNAVRPMLLDNPNSHLICGGTPKGSKHKGLPHRFYELIKLARSPKWKVFHFTTFDNPLLSKQEIKEMIDESSEAVSRQEIYGEFLSEDASVLIDSSLIEAAAKRKAEHREYRSSPKIMGIDVGWANDPTIVCKRQGVKVYPFEEIEPAKDDTITAARIAQKIRDWKPDQVCIDYGYGTGIVSILNNLGFDVHGIHFGSAALDPEKHANMRAGMYDGVRGGLTSGWDIPNDEKLKADLGAIGVGHNAKGLMLLESKDSVKDKLGRSTDRGDALALTKAMPIFVTDTINPDDMTLEEEDFAFITGQLGGQDDIQDFMVVQ